MGKIFSFDNFVTEYKSKEINSLTSDCFIELKERIIETINNRKSIKSDLLFHESELRSNNRKLKWRILFPFGKKLFKEKISFLEGLIRKNGKEINEKKDTLDSCIISIKMPQNKNITSSFFSLKNNFNSLSNCEYIWDITTSKFIDRVKMRTSASNIITRKKVNIFFSSVDLIRSDEDALHFQNANGGDIYFYPSMIIVIISNKGFALLDYKDITLNYVESRFVEEERLPSDTKQIGTTWAKVNKDGSRDRRFNNNYQIPIVLYGQLHWESKKGFNEVYQFSNPTITQQFYKSFVDYKNCIKPA
jgi:hypothetical protein